MTLKPFYNIWDIQAALHDKRDEVTDKLRTAYALADRGPYLIDPLLTSYTFDMAERCRQVGSVLTLGFKIDPFNPDRRLIEQAAQLTPHLAIGNTRLNEWHHVRRKPFEAERAVVKLQGEIGFQWRCPLLYCDVMRDPKREIQKFLVEHQIPICCLCGYKLTSRPDLPDWLAPLPDPWTGAGGRLGLEAGSYEATRKAGFAEVVCSAPIPEEFS